MFIHIGDYDDDADDDDDDVAEALATCIVNTKLMKVEVWNISPIPVMRSLASREVPLGELDMWYV